MLIPIPLLIGLLLGIIVGVATGSFFAAWLTLLIVSMVVAVVLYFAADAIALKLLGARPLAADGSRQLRNSLDELCARTGLNEPMLYTTGPGSPAIASFGRREPSLVVTDGLSDDLTVVELEAALARELARSQSGATNVDTLAVPFVTLPFGMFEGLTRRILQWFRGGDYDARCDLEGVGITRYPPGLAAALRKMTEADSRSASGAAAVAHLWAVRPQTGKLAPGQYGVVERLELLSEL
jgi:hypothetical protein